MAPVEAQAQAKKPGSPEWTESLNANSVQLIAMLVSDAGIAADQPQWWNGSPLGCLLIGVQPRGGWQILQRSVQWGQDGWAASFGVSCPSNILYQYFSCSIRNRIEVWNSDYFYSPTVPHEPINTADDSSSLLSSATTSTVSIPLAAAHRRGSEPIPLPRSHSLSIKKSPTVRVTPVRASTDLSIRSHPSHKKTPPKIGLWHHFMVDGTREFDMFRPSKLVDGSRGGNGFMCELLCPKDGATYTIDEQAYMQYLSVVLVAMALVKEENLHVWDKIMRVDLQVDTKLGRVFLPLRISLALFNILTIGLAALTAYSMFRDNLFGKGLPFVVQIASFCAWAFGAVGLLMIGGNPRVEMVKTEIPEHIRFRIEDEIERAASSGFNEGREVSYSERQFIKLRKSARGG
ncbi:hypothetical protein DRE_01540 [Drechslerella stenobrocha 248]|uniref:Uncharacterized protein n=1 Tax=Drechslerella stenobrocha 248 TaxID=1043628 RepID=W7HUY8_9PEZI|nr:hypothetical protein DRE_01540 [Drechslerella stenobrocha 248]